MTLSTLVLVGAHAQDGLSPQISRVRFVPIALIALLGLLLASTSFANEVVTWVDAEGTPLSDTLQVGDHLEPGLSDLTPGSRYRMQLLDEGLNRISEIEVQANAFGQVDSSQLWRRTGVVGCNSSGKPGDNGPYEYSRFEDAALDLVGRQFHLRLMHAQTATVVADRPIQVEDRRTPLFYFADATGCPRSHMEDHEDLYLAAFNLPVDGTDFTFFLVDRESSPAVGDAILDVRSAYAGGGQVIEVEADQTQFLELVWDGVESIGGGYMGILRMGYDITPIRQLNDWHVGGPENKRTQDGITVVPWDCPTCGDDDGGGGS